MLITLTQFPVLTEITCASDYLELFSLSYLVFPYHATQLHISFSYFTVFVVKGNIVNTYRVFPE